MNSLFVFSEIYTNGYRIEALDVMSLFAVLCGILVIIIKNPVVSVLFLIGLFVCIASYLSLLGLNFIGLSYLLVYVGAVSILFLFILMLINVRVSELTGNPSNSIPLAIFICISFNYPIRQVLPFSIASFNDSILNFNLTIYDVLGNKFNNLLNNIFNINSAELDNGVVSYVTSNI